MNDNKKEWLYLDSQELEQGPFSLAEMRAWWIGGFFPADLKVRLQREYKFLLLQGREDYILFKDPNAPDPPLVEQSNSDDSNNGSSSQKTETPPGTKPQYQEYSITGTFNSKTGRWESKTWDKPNDRAIRQMSHYFDLEKYQRIRSGEEKAPRTAKRKTKVEDYNSDDDKHNASNKEKSGKKKRLAV